MHLSWLVQVDTGAHGRRSHQAGVSKSWSCRDCGASVVMLGCLLHQQLRKTYQETAQSGKHQKSMLSRIVWTSRHHAQNSAIMWQERAGSRLMDTVQPPGFELRLCGHEDYDKLWHAAVST